MTGPDRPPAGPSPDSPPPGPRTLVLSRTQPDPMPLPPIPRPSKAWHHIRAVGFGLAGGALLAVAGLTYIGVAVTR